jgi:predicted transcriptional regulator
LNPEALSEVLSSRVRMKIADAVSVRPRTLNELAFMTGISVQGVLRHLKLLMKTGLVEERKVFPRTPKARRVYVAKTSTIGDYSWEDLTIVKYTERTSMQVPVRRKPQDLERVAGEMLIHRRRITDRAKKLGRLIDDLVAEQEALEEALEEARVSSEERLMLGVLLTEDTIEDGVKVLSRYYGLEDRRSIDKALAKARRIGVK